MSGGRRTTTPTPQRFAKPSMRFVPIKTEGQAALMLHPARSLLLSQRSAPICAIVNHMAELGLTARPA